MLNNNEYLKKILEDQVLSDDDLNTLKEKRNDVTNFLRSKFPQASIRWAGSVAKGTIIKESYDADTTCYFPCDKNDTLQGIYREVGKALEDNYKVDYKTSALRIKDKYQWQNDFHIDIVPGRYIDDAKGDVFLHCDTDDRQRLKTNLDTHISHIRDSGVTDAIKLMKLWKIRNGLDVRTFVIELLTVKLLKDKSSLDLSSQLQHIWTELRDKQISVEDPANPGGNDLKPLLNGYYSTLSNYAGDTIYKIEHNYWEKVYGEIGINSVSSYATELSQTINEVAIQTKPWLEN
jgi:Second Messenger Oligonucleotide or Dinucleotide Synthetase domain